MKKINTEKIEKYKKVNEIIERYNIKFNNINYPEDSLEKIIENFRVMSDINYELVKLGEGPLMIPHQEFVKIILISIKELKKLKEKINETNKTTKKRSLRKKEKKQV